MKKVTITLTFTGATGGIVSVLIQGPLHHYTYQVDTSVGNPPMDFQLNPALYNIRVDGHSGGKVALSVDEGATNLVTDSCKPGHIYMSDPFIVK